MKILIVGFVWPEPESSAAGRRMMQLLKFFQDEGYDITFATCSAPTPYSSQLPGRGITSVSIELNSSGFDEFISQLQPSLVVFDRYLTEEQFGWRVSKCCPEAIRILDTEDLQCLRKARHRAVKSGASFSIEDLKTEEIAKREVASILRCDLSLIISEFEMDLLTEVFAIDRSLLFYFPLIVERTNSIQTEFSLRRDFVFIGNFLHDPNSDAMVFLKENIWPEIHRRLPQAVMDVFGAYVTPKIQQLNDPAMNFFIRGRAANAADVIAAARVMLAPMRFGAGLKGKLIEAMEYGTPSITTSVGAEGINGGLPWNGFIADDPSEFADCAVRLYEDQSLLKSAAEAGEEILERFRPEQFHRELSAIISGIGLNLKKHRTDNFVGAMLNYHTMRSTEFMSRWIEEKNKSLLQ